MPADCTPARRVRGFSLLEILVAFSIMALALGVLYQATGGSVRAAAHGERHAHAVLIAESLLGRFETVPGSGIGDAGRTDDGFRWRVASHPYAGENLAPPAAAPTPGGPDAATAAPRWPFHAVAVEVEWDNLGRTHSIVLETVLPQDNDVE